MFSVFTILLTLLIAKVPLLQRQVATSQHDATLAASLLK